MRLAAELIGCQIDIKSESDVKDEVAGALARMLQTAFGESAGGARPRRRLDLTTVPGIGPRKTAGCSSEAGLRHAAEPCSTRRREALQAVEGVGPKTAVSILNWAKEQAEKASAAEPAEPLGARGPMAIESSSSMNDQDFMAALSRAFKESEDRAKVAEDAAPGRSRAGPGRRARVAPLATLPVKQDQPGERRNIWERFGSPTSRR